jgi:glycosyltransferase involved in cell wall biosynthesis
MKTLKLAFFSSAKNYIPCKKTGGVEQPLFYYVKELAKRGHKIVLYAASKSKIPGVEVRSILPQNTRNLNCGVEKEKLESFYDSHIITDFFSKRESEKFDLIGFFGYKFYEYLPYSQLTSKPVISQINYPHEDIFPHIKNFIRKYKNVHYLPMSDFIVRVMPVSNCLPAIYPVFNANDFNFSSSGGECLLFIGRICREKGVDIAIEAAKRSNKKLIIAGPVRDNFYFDSEVKPFIDRKKICYVGEVDFKEKIKLYQKSFATLFPSQWNEPFGIVMAESMACGTPVITFDRAAAREIVKDGISGFIVKDKDINQMVKAIGKVGKLERKKVREYAEKKFSLADWASKLEKICLELVEDNKCHL